MSGDTPQRRTTAREPGLHEVQGESDVTQLGRALESGGLAEWSYDLPGGRWLVISGFDRLLGNGGSAGSNEPQGADETSSADRRHTPLIESVLAGRLHPEDIATVDGAWHRLAATGEAMRCEVRILPASGRLRWMRIDGEVTQGTEDEPVRLSGLARDITELKRLRATNTFLGGLTDPLAHLDDYDDTLQRVADLIVPFLADRCIIEFVLPDGSLERIADSEHPHLACPSLPPAQSAEHVPSARLIDRIVSERRSLVLPDIDDAQIRGLSSTPEQSRELCEYKPCDYIGTPLVIEGRCFGVLGILTRRNGRRFDLQEFELVELVAERIASALENTRLYTTLKEADEKKTAFLAMLSHELRNPLAAIAAGLDVLRSGIVSSSERSTLAMIDRQAGGLSRLLDDLLDVARIDAGKLELNREWLSLTQAIDDAISGVAAAVQGKRQKLTYEPPVPDIAVRADRVRLEQILANLLVNASRYTPDGGSISIGARRDDERIVVDICDTGIGLNDNERTRIFERFEQASEAHAPGNDGLGLGLHLARTLVQLHDGTITADSAGRGRGSRFSVVLPHVDRPACRSGSAPSGGVETGSTTAGIRVLIIDDNQDAAKALEKVLTRFGHRIDNAATGEEGVDAYRAEPADLVVLDIGLPDIDGYAVAERIREHERLANLEPCRLIALTGYGQASDRERALQTGFDEHVVKPVRLEQLRELVNSAKRRNASVQP